MFEFYLLISAVLLSVVALVILLLVLKKRKNVDAERSAMYDNMIDAGEDNFHTVIRNTDNKVDKKTGVDDDLFEDKRLMSRLNNVHERRKRAK